MAKTLLCVQYTRTVNKYQVRKYLPKYLDELHSPPHKLGIHQGHRNIINRGGDKSKSHVMGVGSPLPLIGIGLNYLPKIPHVPICSGGLGNTRLL